MINLRKVLAIATLAASQLVIADTRLPNTAIFDLGTLDTMSALGLDQYVVGVPKQGLPDYLQQFNKPSYTDIGGLKTPDIAALTTANPDLIIITGRQAGKQNELAKVAAVKQMDLSGDHYWHGLSENVTSIAAIFHSQDASTKALSDLHAYIETTKKHVDQNASILFVTHNSGSFSVREDAISSQLLGINPAKIPSNIKSHKRGNRSFTPLEIKDIANIHPSTLFIVDRSAAIGDKENAVNLNALKEALTAEGAGEINIAYLSPKLWYLSGNGLQSVRMQVKEIADAL